MIPSGSAPQRTVLSARRIVLLASVAVLGAGVVIGSNFAPTNTNLPAIGSAIAQT